MHLLPDVLGNRDATRFGDAFNPRRHIDAVAKNILAIDDDVANVDANPELYRIGLGPTGTVSPQLSLNFNGTGDGVHGAREFHQRAVSHQLDYATRMRGNRRVDQLTPQGVQPGKGAGLVQAH